MLFTSLLFSLRVYILLYSFHPPPVLHSPKTAISSYRFNFQVVNHVFFPFSSFRLPRPQHQSAFPLAGSFFTISRPLLSDLQNPSAYIIFPGENESHVVLLLLLLVLLLRHKQHRKRTVSGPWLPAARLFILVSFSLSGGAAAGRADKLYPTLLYFL